MVGCKVCHVLLPAHNATNTHMVGCKVCHVVLLAHNVISTHMVGSILFAEENAPKLLKRCF